MQPFSDGRQELMSLTQMIRVSAVSTPANCNNFSYAAVYKVIFDSFGSSEAKLWSIKG